MIQEKTLVPSSEGASPEQNTNTVNVEPSATVQPQIPIVESGETVRDLLGNGNVAKNDFYEHTGEAPNFVPTSYEDALKGRGETETPQPAQEQPKPEPVQQPSEDMITIAGKEYKVSEVPTHYENLVKDYHKKNGDHRQERINNQLTISELKSQLDVKDSLLKNHVNNLQAPDPESEPIVEPSQVTFSNEALENAMDEGKGIDFINNMVDSKLKAAEKLAQDSRIKSQLENQKIAMRGKAVENIGNMESMFDSFSENREVFADWMSNFYGKDASGEQRIEEVAANKDSLSRTYKTFLRDTYDFSKEIQTAKSDGQAIAEVKASLQPVGQTSSIDAAPINVAPENPQKEDVDIVNMDNIIWGNRSSPGFLTNNRR